MKKRILWTMVVLFSGFLLNSCDPWEDENGDGPDVPDAGLLLQKTTIVSSNGITGETIYTYDSQNRISTIKTINNVQDVTTYSEVTYQYLSSSNITLTTKSYQNGQLISTTTSNLNVLSSSTATLTMSSELGEISIAITYSTPCGITEAITTFGNFTQTSTYEYFDNKCSYKEFIDGELQSTTFNDDKFNPIHDPIAIAMGLVSHNIIKVEEVDGINEVISYQYNSDDYPTEAVHTFSNEDPDQGILNYTETFEYQ